MPYEKNKTAYQDEEWFEREQRNILDVNRWNRQLLGQTFYSICVDNKSLYKEVRFSINNGSTLEEISSSMSNLKKAAAEISTEQSEELVNT